MNEHAHMLRMLTLLSTVTALKLAGHNNNIIADLC